MQDMVKEILRTKPETRDSFKKLYLEFWDIQGLHLTEDQRKYFILHCAEPSSILRRAQEVQNGLGLYRPTDPMAVQRELFATGWHLKQ